MLVPVAVLLTAVPLWAASSAERAARAPVAVRIYDSAGLSVGDIIGARTEADAILRAAAIEPVWIHCPRIETKGQSSSDRCETNVGPAEIVVRVLRVRGPDAASVRELFGEALVNRQTLNGSYATVFADRVTRMSGLLGMNARPVLGRVIAHEIGHLLLGHSQHAIHGLMRAVWTDQELRREVGLDWRFSASEARRMRERIAERANRLSRLP